MSATQPSELELLILKALWAQSPLTARELREVLEQGGRPLAHTSVITTVQRMVDKQLLEQLDPIKGKAFRFSPLVAEDDISNRMLGDLVKRVFDGSAEAVMMSLFDVADLDTDELAGLRKLLNKKMREAKQ